MSYIAATSVIDFPYKVEQGKLKEYARQLFTPHFPQIDRIIDIFENTDIKFRNFCKPLEDYQSLSGFREQNNEYIKNALEYSAKAITECISQAGITKEDITDLIFVSTTGLATPSMDALLINKLRLHPNINRIPVFGLGCAGGVSGLARAHALATGNPDAVVLVVAVELCSLTFLKDDFSKSNFVASSLFSDGVAACIVKGNNQRDTPAIQFVGSRSKFYYDSLDVMGWEFLDSGFKVIFSQDIPTIIRDRVSEDVTAFLSNYNLALKDINNFIFHPGGKKVLGAYAEALAMSNDDLKNTREVMVENGNMSSATVLYVLDRFLKKGFENGYGLVLALGPGFSSEMVLLKMNNN